MRDEYRFPSGEPRRCGHLAWAKEERTHQAVPPRWYASPPAVSSVPAGRSAHLFFFFCRATVDWGELDYLIVDTPPGTSDEHLSITQYLKSCNPDGAVVVTTPQEVALADVRKEINFCAKVQLPVLGVVENMSGFVCPKCSTETQIFAPSTGGARAMCTTMQVPFLGALPIDPKLARACDEGTRYQLENPTGPVCVALNAVVDQLLTRTESATSAAQPSS